MNNLELINKENNPLNKPAIILRDLWRALELKERYTLWFPRQLEDFIQGIDFKEVEVNHHQGNPLNKPAIILRDLRR